LSALTSALRRVIALGLSSALTGCAITDPQVHQRSLFSAYYSDNPPPPYFSQPRKVGAGDLNAAIDDANAQALAYFDAAAQYSQLRNMTPLAAVGLGVSAALLGIIGGGSAGTRIGLAGAGATALGLGTYYDNRPRQLVYLSGAKAIACAVTAQAPFLLSAEAKTRLETDMAALRASIATLSLALRPPIPTRIPGILTQTPDAEAILTSARAMLSDAEAFSRALQTAGLVLREQVKDIVAAVDVQVVRTDPDPQAIQAVIASVTSAATPPPAASKLPSSSAGPKSSATGDTIDAAAADAVQATDAVQADLGGNGAASAGSAVPAACQVEQVAGALNLLPNETQHDFTAVNTTLVYTVLGGTNPLTASLSGEYPAGAFAVTQTSANGAIVVTVSVAASAAGHSAQLIVADASGRPPHTVALRVPAGATAAPGAKQGTNTADGTIPTGGNGQPRVKKKASTPVKGLTQVQLEILRRIVGIPVTATSEPSLTPNELTAVQKYVTDYSVQATTGTNGLVVDANLVAAIQAFARMTDVKTPETQGETALLGKMPNEVVAVRKACNVQPFAPPAVDTDLRGRIFDFQIAAQTGSPADPPVDGMLTETMIGRMAEPGKCKTS